MMIDKRNIGCPVNSIQPPSDEELCLRAAQGDSEAETELVCRYGQLVRACARPLFLAGGDSGDLIQEGMVGLLTAIRGFDPGRDAAFRTYAEICVRSRLFFRTKQECQHKSGRKSTDVRTVVYAGRRHALQDREYCHQYQPLSGIDPKISVVFQHNKYKLLTRSIRPFVSQSKPIQHFLSDRRQDKSQDSELFQPPPQAHLPKRSAQACCKKDVPGQSAKTYT